MKKQGHSLFWSPFFNHNSYKRIEMMANQNKECNENKLS